MVDQRRRGGGGGGSLTRRDDEPRTDLDKADIELLIRTLITTTFTLRLRYILHVFIPVLAIFLRRRRFGLADLVITDPDAAVGDGEAHDVVDEGFGAARALGHAEHVKEHLLDEPQVRLSLEGRVEREHRPRPLQAVTREVELRHRVHCREAGVNKGSRVLVAV